MIFVSVDVEADGPIPGKYSMISFGAVVVSPPFNTTFYSTITPISNEFIKEALAVSGFTREDTFKFNNPKEEMHRFCDWLEKLEERPIFIADNNGFDWQFINYYLHMYVGKNPFGYSSYNLNSLYKGLKKDLKAKFKKLRDTKHTHNALDDARGNAEAAYKIFNEFK